MHELFELIQEHYNTPYFPEEEISMYLNAGQKKIFNDLVFYGDSQAEADVANGIRFIGKFEMDAEKMNILMNCVLLDQTVAAVSGEVTRTAIETATSRTPALITDVVDTSDNPITIVRQGEYREFKENYFTNAEYTLARLGGDGILIDGGGASDFKISFIAEPREMDLTEPVQPDLIGVHELIVAEGLRIAGYALNDEALIKLKM
jgi:hypothetical protein